jgi:hypothetical protein
MELGYYEVEVTSLAPRFIGEFQKGIDYIGDRDEFEVQLKQHADIAKHFGYKLASTPEAISSVFFPPSESIPGVCFI